MVALPKTPHNQLHHYEVIPKKHVALYWPQVKTGPGGGRFLPEAIVLSISLPNKIERKRSENL